MIAFLAGILCGVAATFTLSSVYVAGRKRVVQNAARVALERMAEREPMLVNEFTTTVEPQTQFLVRGAVVSVPSGTYTREQLDAAIKDALALSARVMV